MQSEGQGFESPILHQFKSKYWYFITYYECPLCGRDSTLRERRYDERPIQYEARHEFIEEWDYCDIG